MTGGSIGGIPSSAHATTRTVALLTGGGIAPCLSSSVASLLTEYAAQAPGTRIIGYRHGYEGLLRGDFIEFAPDDVELADALHQVGGTPLGSSRVKLTNADDLVRRGLLLPGQDPLRIVADRLTADGVHTLHTIGGDDTNGTAADLAAYLAREDYDLTVVGLPKTIDNDVYPLTQTLGADTAAEQGAVFARNVVAEHTFLPRILIVHEVMGRGSGWLTAETTRRYRAWLDTQTWAPGLGKDRRAWDVHALYVPEVALDLAAEAERLRRVMDEFGCATIFVAEGAAQAEIVGELEASGAVLPRDAFGHVLLDAVNPGAWFADQFAARIGAERTIVQKSGFFARSAAANAFDRDLIARSAALAVASALAGRSGVVGEDEDAPGTLSLIDFGRIKGGKPLDVTQGWFTSMSIQIQSSGNR